MLVGWTHAYAPLGTPLVDREAAAAVIAAWLDHIATDPQLPNLVLLPYLTEGPVAEVIAMAVARRKGRSAAFGHHQRALLAPGEERADYLGRSMARKKRKELRRQKRRLMDDGLVVRAGTDEPHDIDGALGDFFTLEAAGWKGRAGTAARGDARVRDFLKNAVGALAREGKVRIDRLLVDTDPIAVMVTLRSGAGVWGWKIAYDEKFSRASPGVQLLLDVTQALLEDVSVARADFLRYGRSSDDRPYLARAAGALGPAYQPPRRPRFCLRLQSRSLPPRARGGRQSRARPRAAIAPSTDVHPSRKAATVRARSGMHGARAFPHLCSGGGDRYAGIPAGPPGVEPGWSDDRLMTQEAAPARPAGDVDWQLLAPLLAHVVVTHTVVGILRVTMSYRTVELGLPVIWLGVIAAGFALVPIFVAVQIGRYIDRGHDARAAWIGSALMLLAAFGMVGMAVVDRAICSASPCCWAPATCF